MKIGVFFDLRFSQLKSSTGVSKHIIELVKRLSLNNEISIIATNDIVNEEGVLNNNNFFHKLPIIVLPFSWYQSQIKWLFLKQKNVDIYLNEFDLIYCPKNDYLPVVETKIIYTFHGASELDKNYKLNKNWTSVLGRYKSKINYKMMLANASKILVVSKFLENQVKDWYSFDEKKIAVIGNGVEEVFINKSKFEINKNSEILLAIGGLNYTDGGDRLLNLAAYLEENNSKYKIIIAGSDHNKELLIKSRQFNNIVLTGYLHSDDLAILMNKANLLLYLTRYETFGIAAAEAMVIGLPIITVKCTGVSDVVQDSGIYVDGDSVPQVIDAISYLVENDSKREKMIRRGFEISKQYNWDIVKTKVEHELLMML